MENVILVGNSITAKIIYEYVKDDGRYNVLAFCAHSKYIDIALLKDIPVVPIENLKQLYGEQQDIKFIMAMGYANNNVNRSEVFNEIVNMGFNALSYVHKDAKNFSKSLGVGCVILPGAVLEPYTEIGMNCMVWSNVVVAHHSVVEDHCWLASNCVISGFAKIKKNCFIGVNATIVNKVNIGEFNIIGAAALISKSTENKEVYLARSGEKIRFNSIDYGKYYLV